MTTGQSASRRQPTYHVVRAVWGWWVIEQPGHRWIQVFTGLDAGRRARDHADYLNDNARARCEEVT